jgi:hypothetical protein
MSPGLAAMAATAGAAVPFARATRLLAGNHDGLAGRGLHNGRDRIAAAAAAAAGVIEQLIDAAAAAPGSRG